MPLPAQALKDAQTQNQTDATVNLQNLTYSLGCLAFTVIIGAAVYEHMAVWPGVFAAPPASLTMMQGEYGLNAAAFWSAIHPVTLLLFVLNLIWSCKSPRRKHLLIPLVGYVLLLAATAVYFVPELLDLTGTEYADRIDADLVARGTRWEYLSLVRLIVLIGLAFVLFLGLTKARTASTVAPHH